MTVFKLIIRTDLDAPDRKQGWALAANMGDALELADHPDAVAIETQKTWPGPGGVAVFWSN